MAGKKAKFVVGSLQIVSPRDRAPETTSTMPAVALGARQRDREGLRRSQSTRITRPPVYAMSWARAPAIVDFPSFGSEDVKPMTLWDLSVSCKLVASLIERTASAKRDKGEIADPPKYARVTEDRPVTGCVAAWLLEAGLSWRRTFQQRDQS